MYCETSNRWCPINSSSCKAIEETHVLPKGALQLICGQTYDLLEQLGPQDCVTFTGSAYTGQKLRNHPHLNKYSIPFSMEADSVNSAILSPEANEETVDLFVREVFREMTTKAGQNVLPFVVHLFLKTC